MNMWKHFPTLVLGGLLIWVLVEKSREVVALNRRCESLQHGLTKVESLYRHQVTENVRIKGELAVARATITSTIPAGDAPYENALDIWITKIKRLNAYLAAHPEKRIPQMSKLTAEEWLDVTKDSNFDTEAEFRQALGRLRGIARQKLAPDIASAIRKFAAENNGANTQDPTVLSRFLPDGSDPALLSNFVYNSDGKIRGLSTKDNFIYTEQPIDLWDSTLFFSANGKWGVRSSTAPGEDRMKNAILQYTKDYGKSPTDFSQISQYSDIAKIPPNIREDLFRAITTKMK